MLNSTNYSWHHMVLTAVNKWPVKQKKTKKQPFLPQKCWWYSSVSVTIFIAGLYLKSWPLTVKKSMQSLCFEAKIQIKNTQVQWKPSPCFLHWISMFRPCCWIHRDYSGNMTLCPHIKALSQLFHNIAFHGFKVWTCKAVLVIHMHQVTQH